MKGVWMMHYVSMLAIIIFSFYVYYSLNRQKKINKKLTDSIFKTIKALDVVSKEGAAIAGMTKRLSEETDNLNSKSSDTRKLCIEIIQNNAKLSSTIEMVIKSQDNTNKNIKRVTAAFNKKAEADKKFVQTLNEYVSKHYDESKKESRLLITRSSKNKKYSN